MPSSLAWRPSRLTLPPSPLCRSGLSLEEVFHVFENDSFAACIKRSEQIRAQKRARVGEIAQGGQAA